MAGPEELRFYNGRGTAEQYPIKEGKYALNWTRLSCRRFETANRVRLSLFVLAYNLGNESFATAVSAQGGQALVAAERADVKLIWEVVWCGTPGD